MSQQKIVFAACVVAALVALVAGQGINHNTCMQKAQSLFTENIRQFQQSIREMTTSLASSGQSTLNLEGINNDVNDLASTYQEFMNINDGVNVQNFMQTGQKVASKQMSILMKYFLTPQMGLDGAQAFIKLQSQVTTNQLELVTKLTTVCFPRNY